MENLVGEAAGILFAQGVLGVCVVALAAVTILQWREMKAVRKEKDDTIAKLQEARLAEAKVVIDVVRTMQSTMDTFLIAVRGKTP